MHYCIPPAVLAPRSCLRGSMSAKRKTASSCLPSTPPAWPSSGACISNWVCSGKLEKHWSPVSLWLCSVWLAGHCGEWASSMVPSACPERLLHEFETADAKHTQSNPICQTVVASLQIQRGIDSPCNPCASMWSCLPIPLSGCCQDPAPLGLDVTPPLQLAFT